LVLSAPLSLQVRGVLTSHLSPFLSDSFCVTIRSTNQPTNQTTKQTGTQYAAIRASGNRHTLFADLAAGTVVMTLFRNFISKPPLSPVAGIVSGAVLGFGAFQTESLIRNSTIQEFVKSRDGSSLIALRDGINERYTDFVDDIVFSLPFVSLDPSLRDVSRSLRNGSLKIEDFHQEPRSQSIEEQERNTL